MSSDTARYFERLRAHLRLGDGLETELMHELEAHVEDRVAALVRRGVPEERARRTAIAGLGRPQTLAHLMRQAQLTTSWGEALLGAAPFAIVAMLLIFGVWPLPLAAAAASALVVGVTLYGLWLGRPAWFYPWAGVALMLPIVAGYIAFAVLQRELPELIAGGGRALSLAGVAGAALYFPIGLVVVAAGVLVAVRRDWLDASVLLSPLPGALAWTVAVHHSGGLMPADASLSGAAEMLGAVYLCMALATIVFLRAQTRSLKFTTLVGTALTLLSAATLLVDPSGGVITFAGRAVLLVAFLLSPALVARHA